MAITPDSMPSHAGFPRRHVCQVYNEAAFRYFLAVERSRAQRSQRVLYLVLVAIRMGAGHRAKLTDATAAAIFRGLGASVREVDFVGWYQESHVAAAVLVQGVKSSDGGAAPLIVDRMRSELKKELSATESRNLRLRVVRLGGTTGR